MRRLLIPLLAVGLLTAPLPALTGPADAAAAPTHVVLDGVDVEALGLSAQQRLRQPSYRGLRPDLGPEDLT